MKKNIFIRLMVGIFVMLCGVATANSSVVSGSGSGGGSGSNLTIPPVPVIEVPAYINNSFSLFGIEVNSHASNSIYSEGENQQRYASANMWARLSQGVGGRYYRLEDCHAYLQNPTKNGEVVDPGAWEFRGYATFEVLDELPANTDVNLSSSTSFDFFDVYVRTHARAENYEEWVWEGDADYDIGEWVPVVTDDITVSFGISLESQSAVVYDINSYVDTWTSDWDGTERLQLNFNATGHLPEPATTALLVFGGFAVFFRRQRQRRISQKE